MWDLSRGIEGNAEGAQFLPENFSYPRYIISIFSYDIDELVRTPYGNQRGKVVDPEGQLWFFNNLYLFDKHGQSKNLVKVTRGFDKKSEEDDYLEKMHGVTPEMAERIKVAFVPKQSDTQLVDLDGQDFEKLGHFFDEIKRGNIRPEFTEKKP